MQRRGAESGLVQLCFYRQQRAAFHPAMSNSQILWETVFVIRGFQKGVRLPQTLPVFLCKGSVATGAYVVLRGNHIQRCGVRGSKSVRIVLEPVDEARALGNFVRNLTVLALVLENELERLTGGRKIAFAVQCKRSPLR